VPSPLRARVRRRARSIKRVRMQLLTIDSLLINSNFNFIRLVSVQSVSALARLRT